jgi:hypothetical protein
MTKVSDPSRPVTDDTATIIMTVDPMDDDKKNDDHNV